jgi:hypothetical protein
MAELSGPTTTSSSARCSIETQSSCCEPSEKDACCGSGTSARSCDCSPTQAGTVAANELSDHSRPHAGLPTSSDTTETELSPAISILNITHVAAETAAGAAVRRVELFEPAMCCESGVCGPSVDQQLIEIREDLRWTSSQGAEVSRHSLSSDPDAFVANAKLTGLMVAFGEQALPALLVDGEIVMHGRYPTREELADFLATKAEPVVELPVSASGDCGCAPGGCC